MRQTNAGRLTGIVAGFSRFFLIMIWIARPVYFSNAFSTFIIPCLGFMILPFTTLMYLFLIQGVGALEGLDWLWIALAVVLDLATLAGAGAANRDRIPAGYPGAMGGPQGPV